MTTNQIIEKIAKNYPEIPQEKFNAIFQDFFAEMQACFARKESLAFNKLFTLYPKFRKKRNVNYHFSTPVEKFEAPDRWCILCRMSRSYRKKLTAELINNSESNND